MDDLFVIDRSGSKDVTVTTATVHREYVITGPLEPPPRLTAATHNVNSSRQIRVIDDDLAGAGATSAPGPAPSLGPRKQPKPGAGRGSSVQGLSSQFIDLNVGDGWANQKRKKQRAKAKLQKQKGTYPAPNDELLQQEVDASIADYIDNLGEEGLRELQSSYAGSRLVERDIGGHEASDIYESGGNDDILVEDPFDYEDELAELIMGGAASNSDDGSDGGIDDDGFPVNLDLENLSDGDDLSLSMRNKHCRGHMQGVQNAKAFKDRDRAKSKNSHKKKADKQPSNGDGPSPGFHPSTILRRLDMLVQSDDLSSIWLQPMNKFERQIVHILAREYNVKSKSHGSGTRRTPVLTVTSRSCRPTNRRRINRTILLFDAGGLNPEQWSGPQGVSDKTGGGPVRGRGKGKNKLSRSSGGGGGAAVAQHGKIVGHGAPVVSKSNVGHKMLQQMGWQPGQGLGANEEGRSTPVDVMIRAGRRGLGA
ncbi:squalene synthetase-like protein [Coemansia sp. Benny D115]|nr:squalene synthetase-like protein [Coemansia sp. Benny D115]